jgi:hypothetical protein
MRKSELRKLRTFHQLCFSRYFENYLILYYDSIIIAIRIYKIIINLSSDCVVLLK